MANWSIARRLTAFLAAALSGLWLLAAGASAIAMRHELHEAFDAALQQTAQRLVPLMIDELAMRANGLPAVPFPAAAVSKHDAYMMVQLRSANGAVLLRSQDAPEGPFAAPAAPGFFHAGAYRLYGEAVAGHGAVVQVAEPLAHRTEAVMEGLTWLLAPLIVLIPACALVIHWTILQATGPIARVREQIRTRDGSNLGALPETELPRELAPIVQEVNRLLQRLSHALDGERDFVANSAHGLRTPVAAALAQAQVLASRLGKSSVRPYARNVVETLRGLAALVEKLLQLSRVEGGLVLGRDPANLVPVTRLVVDEYARRLEVGDRIRFDDGGVVELTSRTDIDAFGIALRNLIDNALAHGQPGSPVDIAVSSDRSIRVVNAGPPVAAAVLATLTKRFERAGARASGSGLGLAIVDAVMRHCGGELRLNSPASGRPDGFEAVIRFPE